jgi:phosphoglycolate phosphatase-like HAD superfamily hydrolase
MLEVFGTAGAIDTHEFGGKTDWRSLADLLVDYTAEEIGARMAEYEQVVARHILDIVNDYQAERCPGALELIGMLRQRRDVLLGLVTGNVSTIAPIKLRAAGFDAGWFPVGAYGSESLDRNDLPRLAIQRAEDYTGRQIHPRDVLVIGDTPMDVACARAVGAIAVAVDTGFASREALVAAQPDYHLKDLTLFLQTVPLTI